MFPKFWSRLFKSGLFAIPTALLLTKGSFLTSSKENQQINEKLKNKLEQLHHHNTELSKEVSDHFRQVLRYLENMLL
jgi:demethoxyubiquinone hydroxylase (CLK1/Coq7/Cat5 family)